MTAMAVEKYFPESEETQKRDMISVTSSLRSTKVKANGEEPEKNIRNTSAKIKKLTVRMFNMEAEFKQKLNSYQTRCFPFRPSKINQYLMVLYKLDSNATMYQPIINKENRRHVKAWEEAINSLKSTASGQSIK